MKQGEAARANLDLDDLERQLSAAAAPRRHAGDDPLAELARIVGYNDRASSKEGGRRPASFDDFLVNPPRSVSDMMGGQPSRVPSAQLPAQPEARPSEQSVLDRADMADAASPPPVEPAASASLQDELAAALGEFEPQLRPAHSVDDVSGFVAAADPLDAPAVEAAPTAPQQAYSSDPRFEDMLKEFDAAMRNVGAQPLAATAPPMAADVEPGPARTALPHALAYDPEAEAAVPATPVAVGRSRLGMALAGGVIGVALIGAASLLAFGGGSKSGPSGAAPVIAAKPGVTKEKPANPGGVEVPNQDKQVLARGPAAPQAERVAPREEQPVDLAQAQRSADAQQPPGVRQIPGVLVVGPASSQPPATAAAPTAPQPRPVASVPITIAGQPPAAELPASAVPSLARPTLPAPIQAAPAAATPSPATPAATPAPAAPPTAAAAPTPAAEPRRVRAVPIRPDEGAPNRAQAQPRVVTPPARPAAPAATAEAEDANAPLRITPQAGRTPNAARTAAVAPGVVPASTPVAPTTTQSTNAEAPASGGSFAVQIAAEGSQDAAQAKFNRMRSQHSGVLGGVSPSIRSAEVNGRSVYRVRVGQLSREEAVSLCERLKADGGSCFVARN